MQRLSVITLLLLALESGCCECVVTNFTRIKNVVPLNGLISRGGYMEKFLVPDLALCASRCIAMSGCRSFFYESNGDICQLHDSVVMTSTGLEPSTSSRYYRQSSTVCEPNWDQLEDSCYFFGQYALSYLTARSVCTNSSSHLVQVDSKAESDFLKYKMAAHGTNYDYWNDLFEVVNGHEQWRTSGDPVVFSDWSPENIVDNHGKESCTVFVKSYGFSWMDVPCVNNVREDGKPESWAKPVCEKDL